MSMREQINALAAAGDWKGVDQLLKDGLERERADFQAEREAAAAARRISPDPHQRAMQACMDGDPDWRDLMPWRWHARRWWWINGTPIAASAALFAVVALVWWWLG